MSLATTMFMKIEGVQGVTGSVAVKADAHASSRDYDGWSEIDSFDFSMTREPDGASGASGAAGGEKPKLESASVKKQPDLASTALMSLAQSQDTFKLIVHICTTARKQLEPYQEFVAEECRLQKFEIGLTANGKPEETVEFQFATLETKFAELSAGGQIVSGREGVQVVVTSDE